MLEIGPSVENDIYIYINFATLCICLLNDTYCTCNVFADIIG